MVGGFCGWSKSLCKDWVQQSKFGALRVILIFLVTQLHHPGCASGSKWNQNWILIKNPIQIGCPIPNELKKFENVIQS